jgi:hypothetical protein
MIQIIAKMPKKIATVPDIRPAKYKIPIATANIILT